MMNKEFGIAAAFVALTSFAIVSSKTPIIDELKVKDRDALAITVEYNYPSFKKRGELLMIAGMGRFGFIKELEGWRSTGQGYLVKDIGFLGITGTVIIPLDYPNAPYYSIKNSFYRRSSIGRYKYYSYTYDNFTIYSNTNKINQNLFKILDNHLNLLQNKTKINLEKFTIYYLNKDIYGMIFYDKIILGGVSDLETIHEFAHIISLFNNADIIKYLSNLYKNAEKFSEKNNLNTKIGHPHRNISELAASIITLYLYNKLPDLTPEEYQAINYISSFYELEKLKGELNGIISYRE